MILGIFDGIYLQYETKILEKTLNNFGTVLKIILELGFENSVQCAMVKNQWETDASTVQ